MIRAFELAVRQLGDPRLRGVIWWSLWLSLVLQVAIAALGIWLLRSFAHFETRWINEAIVWFTGTGVVVLAFMLFPASFGIVISIFMEQIADIVEERHYPELGKARGISIWTGIWTGVVFLVAVVALNLVMLPFYILALFIAGLGAVLFYAVNGWLTGRMYYEQVALRRMSPAEVKAWRRANTGTLWLTGIVIVFLGTIPIVNLIVPVLGVAAMVHVAHTLKPPFNPPRGPR
jgi:CysZ protein